MNGVGEAHKNKTNQTPQYKKNQNHTQENKTTTPDGVGIKKKRNQELNQTPNQDRLEVRLSS